MGVYSCKSCHTCIAVFKGIPQKGNLQLSHLAVQSQQMQIIHPMNQNWKQNSMRSIYEKNQMFELRLYIKVKNDHCSKFSKQLERRGLKKSRLQRNSNPWPPRNVAKRVACKNSHPSSPLGASAKKNCCFRTLPRAGKQAYIYMPSQKNIYILVPQ